MTPSEFTQAAMTSPFLAYVSACANLEPEAAHQLWNAVGRDDKTCLRNCLVEKDEGMRLSTVRVYWGNKLDEAVSAARESAKQAYGGLAFPTDIPEVEAQVVSP